MQRAPAGELAADPVLYGERLYSKASLRIMLSDFANDISTLPAVTVTAPVQLDGNWNVAAPNNGTAYGPISASNPPIARSPGVQTITTTANTVAGDTVIQIAAPPAGLFFHQPVWPMQVWSGNPLAPLVQINRTAITPGQFQNCTNNAGGNLPAVPSAPRCFCRSSTRSRRRW